MLGGLRKAGLVASVAMAILICAPVRADPISLATDGNAMSSFQGKTTFTVDFFGFRVNADVEFAVYAPGQFNLSFAGRDPSGGTERVYAYQIFNLTTLTSDITDFTLGLLDVLDVDKDIEPFTVDNVGFFDYSTGTVAPSSSYLSPTLGSNPTQARWEFFATTIAPGQVSEILLFTCPAPPEEDSATVAADWSASEPLPSPTPEPATLALLSLGAGFMLRRRKRSRR